MQRASDTEERWNTGFQSEVYYSVFILAVWVSEKVAGKDEWSYLDKLPK